MYEALYRKYRPRSFADVVGQEHITETLKTQVQSGRLSHAYLFIGTRGTGKTTCARILAKAVNCEHPVNGDPCNECPSCRGIEEGSILDVVELDAASNNGVDDVRMLRDEAVFSPTAVRKRVYIIDEVHMLSKSAFNALLKILEEPPEHLMFILATTELNKVLPTILSRCQRHSFRRLDGETIAKRLSYVAGCEGIDLTADAAELLGRLADGGMRDGLSLLDQCASRKTVDTEAVLSAMGLAGGLLTAQLARCLEKHDINAALELFRKLWQEGKDPASLLGELAGFFRDALMLRLAPQGGVGLLSGLYDPAALRKLRLDSGELLSALNCVQKYQAGMRDTPNTRLQCELCLVELCGIQAAAPVMTAVPAPAFPKEDEEELPPPHTDEEVPWDVEESVAPAPPPARESENEPEPVEIPVSAAPASAGSWKEILSALERELDMGTCSLLTDEFSVNGSVQGGELLLRVVPGFYMDMVNKPHILGAIQRVSGLQVRVEELSYASGGMEDKLDALSRFNNVTIQ
ncbi:MAG: DNA polymerase III subunit gamma/tau [Ruminococcaceae bacterium]|nr:DNA polymerase III subunit gamma/tau [Oscillospiraceae bacterium]